MKFFLWLAAAGTLALAASATPARAACSSPAQALLDTDGDGTCDLDDGVDAVINVTKARIKRNTSKNPLKPSGIVNALGDFLVNPPNDVFDAADGLKVRVKDTTVPAVDVVFTWAPADCSVTPNGKIRCADESGIAKGIFKPFKKTPSVYRFKFKVGGLPIDPPFTAPVCVTITHGLVTDRRECIVECTPKTAGLICREI